MTLEERHSAAEKLKELTTKQPKKSGGILGKIRGRSRWVLFLSIETIYFRGDRLMPESKGRIGEVDSRLGRSYDSNLDAQNVPRHGSKEALHGNI